MADKSLSTPFLTLSVSETQRLAHTTHQRLFRCCSVENRKVAEVEVLERSNAASNLQILKSGQHFSQTARITVVKQISTRS